MLTRERHLMPARALMPAPAPLPRLSDALARRAAVFGPVDLDEAPAVPRWLWQAVSRLARCVAHLFSAASLI